MTFREINDLQAAYSPHINSLEQLKSEVELDKPGLEFTGEIRVPDHDEWYLGSGHSRRCYRNIDRNDLDCLLQPYPRAILRLKSQPKPVDYSFKSFGTDPMYAEAIKCGETVQTEIIRQCQLGNRIRAIKLMRTATGLGLKDAKNATDPIYEEQQRLKEEQQRLKTETLEKEKKEKAKEERIAELRKLLVTMNAEFGASAYDEAFRVVREEMDAICPF